MRGRLISGMAWLCMAVTPIAAEAQSEPRQIVAAEGENWVHQQVGLVLPDQAAGSERHQIMDATDNELDVWAHYHHPEGDFVATIYTYRAAINDVPLWFDRARIAIEQTLFPNQAGSTPEPVSFAPPGSGQRTALRIAYDLPPDARLSSTALAVLPLGDWLAKVRISSGKLTAAELNARLDAFIAAIGWPEVKEEGREPVAIQPCEKPLTFKPAKTVQTNMEQELLDMAFSRIGGHGLGSFCRDRQEGIQWGLYKSQGRQAGYVLALQDAGRAIGVARRLPVTPQSAGYFVHYFDVGELAAYPAFNRLPSPEQVIESIQRNTPVSKMSLTATEMTVGVEGGRMEIK